MKPTSNWQDSLAKFLDALTELVQEGIKLVKQKGKNENSR